MKHAFTNSIFSLQKLIRSVLFWVCSAPLLSYGQSTTIVISQVYGAGGNSGATYKNDFVELHNVSATAQSLAGWSVQYASAASGSTWAVATLSGSIPAGGYYLVQGGGGTTGTALPAADASATLPNMGATSGKVALLSTATAVASAACPSGSALVDLFGYGSAASCAEGSTFSNSPTSAQAYFRNVGGCTDTNNNSADFSVGTVAPRNAASTAYACGAAVPTAYYAKPTGDLSLPATFGANSDGSGLAPADFTAASTTYTVAGTERTFASSWVVSGTGAKVVLAENASLIVPAGYSFTGTLDQLAGSTLVLKNTTTAAYSGITQGTQAATSTIDFAQAGAYTLPDASALKLQNLRLTGGTKTLPKNITVIDPNTGVKTIKAAQVVPGNLVVDGATLASATTSPYTALELSGNFTLTNGASFTTAATGRLSLVLLGTRPQQLAGNGQDLLLAELDIYNSGGGAVLADAGGSSHLELGSTIGGGYYLETGTTLQLNSNSLRFLAGGKGIMAGGKGSAGQGTVTPTANSIISLENNGTNLTGTLRLTPGATTLAGLRFSSASDVLYLASDLTINGPLNLERGDLQLADNATFTLNGPQSGPGQLRLASSASLVVGSNAAGSLSFAGSAPALANLTLNYAGSLTLASPLSLSGRLRLASGVLTTTATNLLTLGTGASIEGGSESSFVAGPLARTVGAVSSPLAVAFPLGKGTAYRPLTLNIAAQTGTTIYRAEQTEGDPGQTCSSPDPNGPLLRVSRIRSFTITPYSASSPTTVAQPTGFSGNVTLTFRTGDGVGDPAAPSLVVAKRADSTQPWANYGRSGSTGSSSGGTLTSGSFSSFSDFALGSTAADNNPLPVQLVAFAATRTEAGPVVLSWATASELRSARFEAERSRDGAAFTPVASLAAQGTSTQAHHYQLRDAAPPAGPLYYRLRLVDQDGSATYSEAVAVAASAPAELVLSPNPATTYLSLYTEQPTPYLLRTALGQVLRQGSTAAGLTQLAVAELPAGLYLLEVRTASGPVMRRFVKE